MGNQYPDEDIYYVDEHKKFEEPGDGIDVSREPERCQPGDRVERFGRLNDLKILNWVRFRDKGWYLRYLDAGEEKLLARRGVVDIAFDQRWTVTNRDE